MWLRFLKKRKVLQTKLPPARSAWFLVVLSRCFQRPLWVKTATGIRTFPYLSRWPRKQPTPTLTLRLDGSKFYQGPIKLQHQPRTHCPGGLDHTTEEPQLGGQNPGQSAPFLAKVWSVISCFISYPLKWGAVYNCVKIRIQQPLPHSCNLWVPPLQESRPPFFEPPQICGFLSLGVALYQTLVHTWNNSSTQVYHLTVERRNSTQLEGML